MAPTVTCGVSSTADVYDILMGTPMSITLIFSLLLSSLFHLFVYWRRLREDYISKTIFKSGLVVLSFTYAMSFLTLKLSTHLQANKVYDPAGFWFWTALVAYLIGLVYTSKKFRIKLNENFDAFTAGLIVNLLVIYIFQLVINQNFASMAMTLFFLVALILFNFLDTRYHKVGWYKSGKIGFSSLLIFALIFFVRALDSMFVTGIITMSGRVDFVLSLLTSFLGAFSLYNLGEK